MSTKMEWQPIETAPKQDKILVAYETGLIVIALWLDADHPCVDEAGWFEHWEFDPVEPTYWMPLPPPPASEVSQ